MENTFKFSQVENVIVGYGHFNKEDPNRSDVKAWAKKYKGRYIDKPITFKQLCVILKHKKHFQGVWRSGYVDRECYEKYVKIMLLVKPDYFKTIETRLAKIMNREPYSITEGVIRYLTHEYNSAKQYYRNQK